MPTLILETLHCIEDTDAAGLRGPQILSCTVDFRHSQVVVHLAPAATWMRPIDKTEPWPLHVPVATGLPLHPGVTLAMSALIEQPLLGSLTALRQTLLGTLKTLRQAGWQAPDAAAQRALEGVLQSRLTTNGHAPPVRQVHTQGQPGALPPLSFPGETGLYRVWYREAADAGTQFAASSP